MMRNPRPNLRHMKCLVLCALTLLAALPAKAQQGAVTFANSSSTPIRNIPGTNVSARVALYGTTQTNLPAYSYLNPALLQIGATADTFTPGLFSGGARNIGLPADLVTLQVRAWTGGFATFELAYAAAMADPNVCVQCSALWVQPVGGGTLPSQPITGPGRFTGIYFGGFTCGIPEPSVVSLAGLAAVALVVHRLRRTSF
jgi:hypothetical protein